MSNENQNRCVFGLHGITGMLIATVLLLSILGTLTVLGLKTQQTQIQNPYKLENIQSVKKINSNLKLHDIRKDAKTVKKTNSDPKLDDIRKDAK